MPWKASDHLMERMKFISRLEDGERMTDLCKEFGVSRKTGYKILERYKRYGSTGLLDQSRRPDLLARKTPVPIERLIVELRRERPTWGAAKIGEILRKRHPEVKVPTRSTIHEILDRNGLVKKRKKRCRFKATGTELRTTENPNELWCADYKGQFRLGNGKYCYPLTITDHFARYLLACESLESTKGLDAKIVFTEVFEEFGIPAAIRTDNGAPFSTRGILGLSELSIWWLKLGIQIERIVPGKPQQNGRHERMHLTLKQETTRPAGANDLQQQERFDLFRRDYNEVRPHEALGMATPASKYRHSNKKMPSEVSDPDYPHHDFTCYVTKAGQVHVPKCGSFNVSAMFAGELLGLKEEEENLWLVSFADLDLGYFDGNERIFHIRDGKIK